MNEEDGETALILAKENRFDLILSDIGLPGISGIELAKALRSFEKDTGRQATPIVAVTAHAESAHDECIAAGISGVTEKPLTKDLFNEILATFLPTFKATTIE